jgi:hypothetical protein
MIITVELDSQADSALSEIQEMTGLDESRVLSNALSLFLWAARQRRERRIIASMDRSEHRFRELEIPSLDQVVPNATEAENEEAA